MFEHTSWSLIEIGNHSNIYYANCNVTVYDASKRDGVICKYLPLDIQWFWLITSSWNLLQEKGWLVSKMNRLWLKIVVIPPVLHCCVHSFKRTSGLFLRFIIWQQCITYVLLCDWSIVVMQCMLLASIFSVLYVLGTFMHRYIKWPVCCCSGGAVKHCAVVFKLCIYTGFTALCVTNMERTV